MLQCSDMFLITKFIRVRIRTQDGHLQLMVPDEKNISLVTGRNGRILFNGEDISFAYQTVCLILPNYNLDIYPIYFVP